MIKKGFKTNHRNLILSYPSITVPIPLSSTNICTLNDCVFSKGNQLINTTTLLYLSLLTHLLQCPLVRPDALNQRNREWINLVRLMRLVHDRQWHPVNTINITTFFQHSLHFPSYHSPEPETLQIPHLLVQRNDLRQEVHLQLQHTAPSRPGPHRVNHKDPSSDPDLPFLHIPRPVLEHFLRGQFRPETISIRLQLLSLQVTLPSLSQHILHALQVHRQLVINLPGPDNRTCHRWQVPDHGQPATLTLRVLDLELLVKGLNVILHPLDQLRLVLADRSTDMRTNEERIEAGEDPEHLIRILGRSQLIPQVGSDPGLHSVNPLLVPLHCSIPGVNALLGDVQALNLFDIFVRQVDLLYSTVRRIPVQTHRLTLVSGLNVLGSSHNRRRIIGGLEM